MQRIRKVSVIEQSERAISALAEGLLPGAPLPSIRNLSKLLGVSTPTIHAALVKLEKQEVIGRTAGNRPYTRLNHSNPSVRQQTQPLAPQRKLLIISSESWTDLTIFLRTVIGQLSIELAQEGFSVVHEQLNFDEAVRPRKSWDRMLEVQSPTHLLLVGANQTLVEWCQSKHLNFLVAGSNGGLSSAASLQRDLAGGVEDAVRRLRDLGHRRILVPVFNHNHHVVPILQQTVASVLKIHLNEVRSTGVVPLARSENIADLKRALNLWLDRVKPTAVIALNWRNYLLVASALAQKGHRIPEDVSAICMSDDPDAQWYHPTPSHYSMKQSAYLRIIRKWALQASQSANEAIKPVELRWNEGGSVGPAPAKA